MTKLVYNLPVIGQPDTTQDPKIVTAFEKTAQVVNGELDGNNLNTGVAQRAGIEREGVPMAATFGVAGEATRENVAFGVMDEAPAIFIPSSSLVFVTYRCLLKQSVGSAARFALFIDGNQQKMIGPGNKYEVNESATYSATVFVPAGIGNTGAWVSSSAVEMTESYPTTGVISGAAESSVRSGFAQIEYNGTPGTKKISVQFKSSSGNVVIKERKLRVEVRQF